MFSDDFFEKNLCTMFHGGSSFRKFSKKNYSKIQKGRKLFPKVSKRVLNMFWGNFFGKFLPSFPWRVESSKFWEQSKKSQKSKYAQNRSQKCPNVFWTCFGAIFLENFCPLFRGGSSLPKFSKKTKTFQSSKNAQKSSQNYPNVFWTWFAANFSKNFCPVFHGGSSLRNFSKKTKNFQSSKKAKYFTKSVQTCFEHVSGQIFWKIFAQFSMEGRVL